MARRASVSRRRSRARLRSGRRSAPRGACLANAMPSSPPDDARRIFAGIGATYEKAGALLSFGQDARWRAKLISLVAADPQDVVLDVATGTGLVARALRDRYGCEVVG